MAKRELTPEHIAKMQEGRKKAKEAKDQDITMEKISTLTEQAISARNTVMLKERKIKTGDSVLLHKDSSKVNWQQYEGKTGKVVSLNPAHAEILVKGDFLGEVWISLHEWTKV